MYKREDIGKKKKDRERKKIVTEKFMTVSLPVPKSTVSKCISFHHLDMALNYMVESVQVLQCVSNLSQVLQTLALIPDTALDDVENHHHNSHYTTTKKHT